MNTPSFWSMSSPFLSPELPAISVKAPRRLVGALDMDYSLELCSDCIKVTDNKAPRYPNRLLLLDHTVNQFSLYSSIDYVWHVATK